LLSILRTRYRKTVGEYKDKKIQVIPELHNFAGAECLAGLLGARVLSFRVRKSLRFGYIGVKKPKVPASDWSFNLEMSADWLG
jgi:hypothetical protein